MANTEIIAELIKIRNMTLTLKRSRQQRVLEDCTHKKPSDLIDLYTPDLHLIDVIASRLDKSIKALGDDLLS